MASPAAISALRSALACPIDWPSITGLDWAPAFLELEWLRTMDAGCPEREASEFSWQLDLTPNGFAASTDAELEHVCAVLNRARPTAEKAYRLGIGRLARLHFLAPRDHEQGKHACGGRSREEIMTHTIRGPSRFFFEFEASDLRVAFWLCLITLFDPYDDPALFDTIWDPDAPSPGIYDNLTAAEHKARATIWLNLHSAHQHRLALDIASVVGATKGNSTDCMALDVHFDTSVVHAYPISRDEAVRIMGDPMLVVMDNYIRRNFK